MSMVVIAVHEGELRREGEVPSDITDADLGHNPSSTEREPEFRNLQERENLETVTEQPTAKPTEHASKDDHPQVSEDAHNAIMSGVPEGGWLWLCSPARIDLS